MRVQMRFFSVVMLIITAVFVANSKGSLNSNDWRERGQENKLRRKIVKATVAWLQDPNDPNGLEADHLINLLLEQDQVSVKSYFIAAQSARICGNYQKAVSILEDVIEKHPDEKAPRFDLPVKIVGRLWLASITKQSGDISKVKSAYELILKDSENLENKQARETISMICNMYLAEVESEHLNKDEVLARLESVKRAAAMPNQGEFVELYNIYTDWATYEINKIIQKEKAVEALQADKGTIDASIMVAMHHLSLSGIDSLPLSDYISDEKEGEILLDATLNRAINKETSKIDKNLSRFVAGYTKVRAKKYTKAEEYYSDIYRSGDSYFSPIAGISLARCKRMENKIAEADNILDELKTKYLGYASLVNETRESWKN